MRIKKGIVLLNIGYAVKAVKENQMKQIKEHIEKLKDVTIQTEND